MCTRNFWHKPIMGETEDRCIAGRNMDWSEDMSSNLWVFPKGLHRNGGLLNDKNPLTWISKYGTIMASSYGTEQPDGATPDGMNEKGLAGHVLWLTESHYGERDSRLCGLALSFWLQYYLDQFASVAEAVKWTREKPIQLITDEVHDTGIVATAHIALEDDKGESAVIEYLIEGCAIHYSGDYPEGEYDNRCDVTTNSPPFREQLANFRQYDLKDPDIDIPGGNSSSDRFVRTAYYTANLPEPADGRIAVAQVMSVIRNASQPFRKTHGPDSPGASTTRWRTIADLTARTYMFESTTNPTLVYLDAAKPDFSEGAPICMVDLAGKHRDSFGEISHLLEESDDFKFQVIDMKPDKI